MQYDLGACGKAIFVAEFEGTDGRLLGAVNPTEPVVPSIGSVEADVKSAGNSAFLECA